MPVHAEINFLFCDVQYHKKLFVVPIFCLNSEILLLHPLNIVIVENLVACSSERLAGIWLTTSNQIIHGHTSDISLLHRDHNQ